jgi:hypothetical protein
MKLKQFQIEYSTIDTVPAAILSAFEMGNFHLLGEYRNATAEQLADRLTFLNKGTDFPADLEALRTRSALVCENNRAFSLWAGPAARPGMEFFPDEIEYTLPADGTVTDNQVLLSARRVSLAPYFLCGSWSFGTAYPVRVYDDSWGTVFIHRDSGGINGIVRAQTWEDGYGICEDEFFPEADETAEELQKAYGPGGEDGDGETEWTENALFQDAYGFRPNGPNDRDTVKHGIYAKDLNGDHLDSLTRKLRAELDIALTVSNQYGERPFETWSDFLEGPYVIS